MLTTERYLCRGINVMMGYYKAPELTAEVIDRDGWFHTGDIGVFEEGKWLKITDRKKEMFKLSGGKYIAPQVIENKLKESIYIEQAMVIGENEKFASALISPKLCVSPRLVLGTQDPIPRQQRSDRSSGSN